MGGHSVPPALAICDQMSNEKQPSRRKVRLGLQSEDIQSILVGRRGGRPLRGTRVCDCCMLTFEGKETEDISNWAESQGPPHLALRDPLLPIKSCLPKVPQPSKTDHQLGTRNSNTRVRGGCFLSKQQQPQYVRNRFR